MRLKRSNSSKIAIMTVLVFMLSVVFSIPLVQAATPGGLTIEWFKPDSTELSSDENTVRYQVYGTVDPKNVYFCWNFSNGIDDELGTNLQQISLKTKGGQIIDLIEDDFKYTKQQSPKLRQLELILNSTVLQPDTEYVVELGPEIKANNADTGQVHIYV